MSNGLIVDKPAMQKALRAYAAASHDGGVDLGAMQDALEAYLAAMPTPVDKKIAFTCVRTGKRWGFDGLPQLVESFLRAQRTKAPSEKEE